MKSLAFLVAFAALLGACARPSILSPTPTARSWTPAALGYLKAAAHDAPSEGLPDEKAALAELARFERQTPVRPGDQADIAADALFDSLARAFAMGGVNPASAEPDWAAARAAPPDLIALHRALAGGAHADVLLTGLLPQSQDYRDLRAELARVAAEPEGQSDANGLGRDERIARLRANLERWRWLPRALPAARLEVRIAAQQALLYRDDQVIASHIVIVGARRTPSPTFNAEIRSITLNPNWDPPSEIVQQELLPRFASDPQAAARQGFVALDATGSVVANVDWSMRPFPYQVRQLPGPGNALGQLRFDLPNRFAVFLHDTPNHALFSLSDRALSHGCIRIDDPLGLAEGVLNTSFWTRDQLQTAIESGAQQTLPITPNLPVFVLYLTAGIGNDGAIAYFDDIYHRDQRVLRALNAPDISLVAANAPEQQRCPA